MTESVLLVWYNKRPASESIPLRNIFRGGTYPAEEHRYPAPQSLPATVILPRQHPLTLFISTPFITPPHTPLL